MQPIWRDSVAFVTDGAGVRSIEVSAFGIVHAPNVGTKGSYIRVLTQSMLDLIDDVNDDIFAAENDASDVGEVRFRSGVSDRLPLCFCVELSCVSGH